jgi:hypothetical protein
MRPAPWQDLHNALAGQKEQRFADGPARYAELCGEIKFG